MIMNRCTHVFLSLYTGFKEMQRLCTRICSKLCIVLRSFLFDYGSYSPSAYICVSQESIIQPPDAITRLKMGDDDDIEDEEVAFEDR